MPEELLPDVCSSVQELVELKTDIETLKGYEAERISVEALSLSVRPVFDLLPGIHISPSKLPWRWRIFGKARYKIVFVFFSCVVPINAVASVFDDRGRVYHFMFHGKKHFEGKYKAFPSSHDMEFIKGDLFFPGKGIKKEWEENVPGIMYRETQKRRKLVSREPSYRRKCQRGYSRFST